MPTEEIRQLAREDPQAFAGYVDKLPDGRLKDVLATVAEEEGNVDV